MSIQLAFYSSSSYRNLSEYPCIACNVEIFGNSPADTLSPILADFGLLFHSF